MSSQKGHSARLHIIQGQVTLSEIILTPGDDAAVHAERAISLTTMEETEILMVEFHDVL